MAGGITGVVNMAELKSQFEDWVEKKAHEHVDQAIKNAVADVAPKVLETAKTLVPVKSGKLKEALKIRYTNGGTVGKVYVDSKEAHYGFMVHFGTNRQPAQPYLYQASEQHGAEFKSVLEMKIKNESKD